ncbi:MAG: 2-amino-4-hydroxy-6-hydroxymethyldihydropteridine diphosphokinase [Saprospiraceae bacterium]|nr:2-amino-4-hydroxy-6-hydroxymethyldihydropteridine diphosphokinase [Saprospiraceae bacterium]
MSDDPVLVYIGLGANTGDPPVQLQQALQKISERAGKVEVLSSVYVSEPWGGAPPPWFHNQAAGILTRLKPEVLMAVLLDIEQDMGRQRSAPNAPRPIDLDILFYGDRIIRENDLEIPHPRLVERNFVLIPLMEIAPDFVHPVTGLTIEEHYLHSPDRHEVCLI